MGLAVKVGSSFYTVTTPVAYRVGTSGSFYQTKRFLFYDPVTGNLKDGFTDNIAPEDITDLDFSFTGTTGSSSYSAVLTWTQSNDEQDNSLRNEFIRESTPTSSSDSFNQTSIPDEGAAGTYTRAVTGQGDSALTYGSDKIRYKIRVVDDADEASNYDITDYKTLPPKLPTGLSITSTTTVGDIPVPTFSWTRNTTKNAVDYYQLYITRSNGTTETVNVAGTSSSYTPTSSTGYSGGGSVTFKMRSRSDANSTTTYSPVYTNDVSFTLPPQNLPSNPVISAVSYNSITVNWNAPGGSVTNYRVEVDTYTSSTVYTTAAYEYTSAVTSVTRTVYNGTYKIRFRIYAKNYSKYSLATKNTEAGIPPPAPPTPTLTCNGGTWSSTFNAASSTNLTSIQYRYKAQASASYSGWITGNSVSFAGVSGETAYVQARTNSLYTTTEGTAGSGVLPPATSGQVARFTSGSFVLNWTSTGASTYYVYVYNANGTFNHAAYTTTNSYTASSGYFSVGSSGYAKVLSINSYGSGYYSANSNTVKRIANPYVISPTASYTFFTGFNSASSRWQTADIRQGVLDATQNSTGSDQELVGFWFYGNAFDELKSSNLGYSISHSSTDSKINIDRQTSGGSASQLPLYLIGHNYTSVNTALTSVTTLDSNGNSATTGTVVWRDDGGGVGWNRGDFDLGVIPDAFVDAICNGNIKGFACRTGETSAPSNSVSSNYVRWEPYTINDCGKLTIYHTG